MEDDFHHSIDDHNDDDHNLAFLGTSPSTVIPVNRELQPFYCHNDMISWLRPYRQDKEEDDKWKNRDDHRQAYENRIDDKMELVQCKEYQILFHKTMVIDDDRRWSTMIIHT